MQAYFFCASGPIFVRGRGCRRGNFVDLDRARAQHRQVLAILREREVLARGQNGRGIGGQQEGPGCRVEDLHYLLAHILVVQRVGQVNKVGCAQQANGKAIACSEWAKVGHTRWPSRWPVQSFFPSIVQASR